ncbi:MAG: TlpA disulfide reductase family protein [Deltaproteobacteria bacterium]|jgi:thiol-disulfide isomerase/thioredoxin
MLTQMEVTNLDGEDPRLVVDAIPRGRYVIVTMWATYCPPCVDELSMFQKVHRDGHAILGVSFDAADERDDVKALLAKKGATFPQVIVTADAMKRAGRLLEGGLPFAVVVDETGAIVRTHTGKMSEPWARAALAGE